MGLLMAAISRRPLAPIWSGRKYCSRTIHNGLNISYHCCPKLHYTRVDHRITDRSGTACRARALLDRGTAVHMAPRVSGSAGLASIGLNETASSCGVSPDIWPHFFNPYLSERISSACSRSLPTSTPTRRDIYFQRMLPKCSPIFPYLHVI